LRRQSGDIRIILRNGRVAGLVLIGWFMMIATDQQDDRAKKTGT
jgi:hypothetical protein